MTLLDITEEEVTEMLYKEQFEAYSLETGDCSVLVQSQEQGDDQIFC
jgi:hypothetical protein